MAVSSSTPFRRAQNTTSSFYGEKCAEVCDDGLLATTPGASVRHTRPRTRASSSLHSNARCPATDERDDHPARDQGWRDGRARLRSGHRVGVSGPAARIPTSAAEARAMLMKGGASTSEHVSSVSPIFRSCPPRASSSLRPRVHASPPPRRSRLPPPPPPPRSPRADFALPRPRPLPQRSRGDAP